jgi:hypothetical protein
MSTTSVIITLLSLLAGFCVQAVNSGSLFGIVTVPKAWLPYVSLIGTFLAGFVASLTTAGSVTSATLVAAVMAGLTALTGTVVGVTAHQHLTAHLSYKAPANDNGAPPAEKAA